MKKITIAVDGLSSCGKSTMAKWLAKSLGYIYVDTGAMYRSVALYALNNQLFNADGSVNTYALKEQMSLINISFTLDETTKTPITHLNGTNVEKEIRTLEVSNCVSLIASIPFVRTELVAKQQQMGKEKGIVMDGRDIGTVVFPDAELKLFVTASAEVRAKRRFKELEQKGIPGEYNDILKNIEERDKMDSTREVSPLRQAPDAILFDNSHLTKEEQNQKLLSLAQQAINS